MHAQKQHVWLIILGGLLGLLLAGCATNVGETVKVSDEQLAKYDALSVTDAVAALEKRINDAKAADMPFFAPDYFREASEILSDAQKSAPDVQKSADKEQKDDLIGRIAKAVAILDKGHTMTVIVQSQLVNELAMKKQMDADNVAKVFPSEYDDSISDLSDLIEKVELQKTDNLDKNKIELLKTMQALDVKTIQYTTLHDSEAINEDTQSKDGDKQAPVTLAKALSVYQDAENRISQAPHDKALVQRAGADALFAARHARYVNERVVALQNQIKKAIEPVVIGEEKRLLGISAALGHRDVRDLPIEKQAEELAQAASAITQSQKAVEAVNDQTKVLEENLQQTKAQLAEKDEQLKILSDKVAQLEAQNRPPDKAQADMPKAEKPQPESPAD